MSPKNTTKRKQPTLHYLAFKEQYAKHLLQYDPKIQKTIFKLVKENLFHNQETNSLDTIVTKVSQQLSQKRLLIWELDTIVLEIINFFGNQLGVQNTTPHTYKKELKHLIWPIISSNTMQNPNIIDAIAEKIIYAFTNSSYISIKTISNKLHKQAPCSGLTITQISNCVTAFFQLLDTKGLISEQ